MCPRAMIYGLKFLSLNPEQAFLRLTKAETGSPQ